MTQSRQPTGFFVKGILALLALFAVTFFMEPRPELTGLRVLIIVGLGIVCLKMVLRRHGIDWPRRGR
jgi:hypothetical protein